MGVTYRWTGETVSRGCAGNLGVHGTLVSYSAFLVHYRTHIPSTPGHTILYHSDTLVAGIFLLSCGSNHIYLHNCFYTGLPQP